MENLNNLITMEPISSTMALINSNYSLNITVGMVNAQSLKSKEWNILEYIEERNLDVFNIRNVAERWRWAFSMVYSSELNRNGLKFMWSNRRNKK